MLDTISVKNKVQHIANKIERRLCCKCDIVLLLDPVLEDGDLQHLMSDRHIYACEFDLHHKATPYVKRQIEYLNRWLKRYNAKHGTMFVCLGYLEILD